MRAGLLEQARKNSTPLVQNDKATFVWHGDEQPRLIGDFNGWADDEDALMDEIEEGVWVKQLAFPANAYVEYIFHVGDERRHDLFNRKKISNGLGKHNNYFYMPAAQSTPEVEAREDVPAGALESFELGTGGYLGSRTRRVTLYSPPVEQAVPLVVVYDGSDYIHLANLAVIVDNLIADGKIQPLALAFLENGKEVRTLEYSCAEATLNFILFQVLPLAEEKLNLLNVRATPGSFGVVGASMSGLMSLFTGLRLPHIFGKVLSQSGAFTLDGYEYVVWDLARQAQPGALRVWLDVGSFEYLVECNLKMAELLNARGVDCVYHEYAGGHNYTVWRNDLPAALQFLYGV
jgi:enterochelin esterase-like enzyme